MIIFWWWCNYGFIIILVWILNPRLLSWTSLDAKKPVGFITFRLNLEIHAGSAAFQNDVASSDWKKGGRTKISKIHQQTVLHKWEYNKNI